MNSLEVRLKVKSEPAWVKVIMEHFDEFMIDHAECERKASAMAMHMVSKYPDRTKILRPLINLAVEELTHFKQVYFLMQKRGLKLMQNAFKDPYVNHLNVLCRNGRDERFLDRLLIASVIESRGAERFCMVADALRDPALKKFYQTLVEAESRHGNIFVRLARHYFNKKTILSRLDYFTDEEARIIQALEWRPSLH